MHNSNYSHRGSAIIVALVIVVLLSILTVTFLEKVLNLAKSSGNINSSAQSYSFATSIIEEQLMDTAMTKTAPWNIPIKSETSTFTGRSLIAATGGITMPVPGKGNSEFDSDWNIISMGDPVQIVIPDFGVTEWTTVNFHFRVPRIPGSITLTGTNTSITNSGIILWTFGYSGASLYASGETNIFRGSDINGSSKQIQSLGGGTTNGITNTGIAMSFSSFYNTYRPNCAGFQCTLKLSMIRPFLTDGGQSFPFLEYKIDTLPIPIPSQYMVIDSSAYINGYLRSRKVRIQQITTSTAADFAILQ